MVCSHPGRARLGRRLRCQRLRRVTARCSTARRAATWLRRSYKAIDDAERWPLLQSTPVASSAASATPYLGAAAYDRAPTIGRGSPAGRSPIGTATFKRDDPGYKQWTRAHEDGFVLTWRSTSKDYSIHNSGCPAIFDVLGTGQLTAAGKVCSDDRYDRERHARERTKPEPVRCDQCESWPAVRLINTLGLALFAEDADGTRFWFLPAGVP